MRIFYFICFLMSHIRIGSSRHHYDRRAFPSLDIDVLDAIAQAKRKGFDNTDVKTVANEKTQKQEKHLEVLRKMLDSFNNRKYGQFNEGESSTIPARILKSYKKMGLRNPNTLVEIEKMVANFDKYANSADSYEKPVMRNHENEEDEDFLNYDIDGVDLRIPL